MSSKGKKIILICPNCGSRDTRWLDALHRWCMKCEEPYSSDE